MVHLSNLYERPGPADVEVKVLRGNGTGDIVDQYVRFCKISDEEQKKYGRNRKAIKEMLHRCIVKKCVSAFFSDLPERGGRDYCDFIRLGEDHGDP